MRWRRKSAARGQRIGLAGAERVRAAAAAAAGIDVEAGDVGVEAVDDHRTEATPTRSSRG